MVLSNALSQLFNSRDTQEAALVSVLNGSLQILLKKCQEIHTAGRRILDLIKAHVSGQFSRENQA